MLVNCGHLKSYITIENRQFKSSDLRELRIGLYLQLVDRSHPELTIGMVHYTDNGMNFAYLRKIDREFRWLVDTLTLMNCQ